MRKFFGKSKEDKTPTNSNPSSGTSTPVPQYSQQAPPPRQAPPPSQSPAPSYQSNNSGGYGQGPDRGGYGGGYGGGGGGYGRGGPAQDDDSNRGALFGNRQPGQQGGGGGYGSANNGGGYSRPGGYAASTTTVDSNREQLFGNHQQQQQLQERTSQPQPPQSGYGQSGYGAASEGRQKTAEEEEEEDVDAVKQQIRFTKQESVSSTRRALQAAAQAEETGRNTLARLGAQGERLHNTKMNLDLAHNQNKKAEETTRELKTLNGSMFAVHVKNPFNSKQRAAAEEERILREHQEQSEDRERVRAAAWDTKNRVNNALSGRGGYGSGGASRGGYGGYGSSQMSMAERSKYQFEADESDDEKEKEIEHNLDQIGSVVGRLKNLALATNEEVDKQNEQIDLIMKKTDQVDLGIVRNTNKLKRIH